MILSTSHLQRFFYSHYFHGGLRQAAGVLLPALVLSGVFGWHTAGFVAAVGAACVAILDQPGGPRRYGLNGMFAALCLGSATTALTGLASSYVLAIWLIVPVLCFGFSMLTVYGKHGGLLGFACLLIMTLTLRTPLTPADVLQHTLTSFLGGAFYLLYSTAVHRLLWHREEQQALSVALFATADYIAARACFYDIQQDLDDSYRTLIHRQALMTEAHQAARDMVLRELPHGDATHADRLRQGLLNLFVDMINLLDSMVATHTDYATLRHALPDSDILLFVRDAMRKLAANVDSLALNVARNRRHRVRNSVKAELRALEFELQQLREHGMPQSDPELYALLVQVLRRLRNMTRQVDRMADHSINPVPPQTDPQRANQTLNRFLTRQKWRVDLLTRNLNRRSAHFRYALRVAVAALLAMVVGAGLAHAPLVNALDPGMAGHGYWIILTVLIIMKPGFALTRQRNGKRLAGTLIGCGLSLLLFSLVENPQLFLFILVASSVLGYSLVQVNYTLSAMFNTLFVLLVFHFLAPGSNAVVGERLADTAIGSILALTCSYILPSWERNTLSELARALRAANQAFLQAGQDYVHACRTARAAGAAEAPETEEAHVRWRLARKDVHIAFSNFASAFYRMMDEPVSRQRHVPELNRLLIQSHTLASQIAAVIPHLAQIDHEPEGILQALAATQDALEGRPATPPNVIETEGDYATIAYPLRQMIKAAQRIDEEMQALSAPVKPAHP
ncbi:MAG: FUSC family membrane protein [Castellaniella sp.]|uniref:FUSC family protein n=1 Tax=Castellaniella sp. TaxID=1955812 RepID=UPI002A362CAB|nr:FUSC family membrane protein [Castellaniella sp.]MDY0308962.1 FUSC family membrane protein [Castellaniella sp.]